MPIYEYACSACGHQFEEWQKINDKPVRTCPKCKAKKVERLISADVVPPQGRRLVLGPLRGPQAQRRQGSGGEQGLLLERGGGASTVDHQVHHQGQEDREAA